MCSMPCKHNNRHAECKLTPGFAPRGEAVNNSYLTVPAASTHAVVGCCWGVSRPDDWSRVLDLKTLDMIDMN